MEKKHTIEVSGIKVYAYHGCLEEESIIGQKYTVDVSLETSFTIASTSDELSDTIDYVVINKIVEENMAVRHKLIETVAQSILDTIKEKYDQLYSVSVRVIKPCPPISGNVDSVSVKVEESF